MSSRKRITIALVGMILLVVVGWIVRQSTGSGPARSLDAVTARAAPQQATNHSESLVPDPAVPMPVSIDIDG